jgi:5-methylcytosine-specific restriction enzyme B
MSELRRVLIAGTLAEILIESTGPVPAGRMIEELQERLELNDRELSKNNSGQRRFETFARFLSGWLTGAGLLDKSDAGWVLNDEGRALYAESPGPVWLSEVGKRYRSALSARKQEAGWSDPRWQVAREAMEAIPEGAWSAYKDLADLVEMPPQVVGNFISNNDVPNAHRVLTIDGTVAEEFRWADPSRTDKPHELLEAEGVTFDATGHASPDQRFTTADMVEIIGRPSTGNRAWLVRGSAVGGVNLVPSWLEESFVSLAASNLRAVEPPLTLDEVRRIVDEDYAHLTYNQKQSKVAEIHAFANRMNIGDSVITTAEGQVYVGRLTSDAVYAGSDDKRITLRRDAEWDLVPSDFTDIPEELRTRLGSAATIVDLTEVTELVDSLFHGQTVAPPVAPVPASVSRLTSDQAKPLLVGREWLDEFVDLLEERRQVVLYGPPGTGKTYLALKVAESIADPTNVSLVQFHPAYSYEDFFEGYRPAGVNDDGRVGFELTPGPLRRIVDRASQDPANPYVLIVDEINRANLAKVFGELYFLLEYRSRSIDLMYSSGDQGRAFTLPKNLYLIGTMNTADRSIALVDSAMRRRFAFLSLHPNDKHLAGVLRAWLVQEQLPTLAADMWAELNRRIIDEDFKVGPSYFMRPTAATEDGLRRIWRTSLMPLLEELHYGDDSVDVERMYGFDAVHAAVRRAVAAEAAVAVAEAEQVDEAVPVEAVEDES